MKYIDTLVWAFILGQVAYYLGSQLTTAAYDFKSASILGIVIAITVFIIAPILKQEPQHDH
ncbi:YjzD family protein [Globicatella sulfidifaciens]